MLHHFWKLSVALRKKVGLEKNKKGSCTLAVRKDFWSTSITMVTCPHSWKKIKMTWSEQLIERSGLYRASRWLIRSFILIWGKSCKDPVQEGCRHLSFQCCRSHSQASANVAHHPTALKRGARWHFTSSSTTHCLHSLWPARVCLTASTTLNVRVHRALSQNVPHVIYELKLKQKSPVFPNLRN